MQRRLPVTFASLIAVASLAAVAVSCSSKPSGTLSLTTGGESDTFTRAPLPTKLVVEGIDIRGKSVVLGETNLPADSLSLGDRAQTDQVSIKVSGFDAAGARLLSGGTQPVQLGALDGLALAVFVQRTGELARMPSGLTEARESPLTGLVSGRFAFAAGGRDNEKSGQIYDLASLDTLGPSLVLPRAAKSLAIADVAALLVDATGATFFDLSTAAATEATAPSGGAFADVAGGASIAAPDGVTWIVGGTRSVADGAATSRVLRVASDHSLSFVSLAEPRTGAAATWVDGRGLVVVGGSSAGAGVEIVGAGATAPSPLAFPADPVVGAGAVMLDAQHVLVVGGFDPAGAPAATRVLDLSCASGCSTKVWSNAALPVALAHASSFSLEGESALFLGDDASGASHLLRVSENLAQEVGFKVPRKGARSLTYLAAGLRSFIVFGGVKEIESFAP